MSKEAVLNKKPATGMKDILPQEMKIRDYVLWVINETYGRYGFSHIETPAVESISNLNCKAGGENEKLIFKIMKRGEKLNIAQAKEELDLSDLGLRYDLTVPLVRFYANNSANLPSPFKALQYGPVWRADRPQRGRYRQFYQCDIDILGEGSNLAEIELILATTATLGKLSFKNFQIRINDRRILKSMAAYAGFPEDKYEDVFITLDKMDKIGKEGVSAELKELGLPVEAVDKYLTLFEKNDINVISDIIREYIEPNIIPELKEIIDTVDNTKEARFDIVFDPTLVRGMGYYTGPIFEIAIPEFGGSCGGGGRYDGMVRRFTGQDVPACGFSIGFERIVLLLLENGFEVPGDLDKVAFLIEKGIAGESLMNITREANALRQKGTQVLLVRMNKNKKFQKEALNAAGYKEFKEFYKEELKK